MAKFHIKKDDQVIVLAGADKGKTGKVLKVIADKERAIVEGREYGLEEHETFCSPSSGGHH